EGMLPTCPTYRIDVLIEGRALHAAAHRVRDEVVGESEWARKVGNSIDLWQAVDDARADILAVIRGISFLTSVAQAKAELIHKRWRDRGNHRRGIRCGITHGGSGKAARPGREL